MSKWQTVFRTNTDHQAQIAKDVLAEYDIQSILFNLKDSSHHFGQIELRVQSDNVIEAIRLLQEIQFK